MTTNRLKSEIKWSKRGQNSSTDKSCSGSDLIQQKILNFCFWKLRVSVTPINFGRSGVSNRLWGFKNVNGLYFYHNFLVWLTTQSAFTQQHILIYTVLKATLCFLSITHIQTMMDALEEPWSCSRTLWFVVLGSRGSHCRPPDWQMTTLPPELQPLCVTTKWNC